MEAVPERKAARQQSGETSRGNDATQLISSSLEEKFKYLDKARKEMSDENTKPKIQKIPFMLRDNDNFKKYLEPRMVSIGPFHAKNSNLQVERGKQAHYCYDEAELKKLQNSFPSNASYNIQRFKGLGEMMPVQLWETTMNREQRLLKHDVGHEDSTAAMCSRGNLMGGRSWSNT